jgi:hypothetical protein
LAALCGGSSEVPGAAPLLHFVPTPPRGLGIPPPPATEPNRDECQHPSEGTIKSGETLDWYCERVWESRFRTKFGADKRRFRKEIKTDGKLSSSFREERAALIASGVSKGGKCRLARTDKAAKKAVETTRGSVLRLKKAPMGFLPHDKYAKRFGSAKPKDIKAKVRRKLCMHTLVPRTCSLSLHGEVSARMVECLLGVATRRASLRHPHNSLRTPRALRGRPCVC